MLPNIGPPKIVFRVDGAHSLFRAACWSALRMCDLRGQQAQACTLAHRPVLLWTCRKNAGRNLPGPGLPLSLDLLERIMDTLELASASLSLPQVSSPQKHPMPAVHSLQSVASWQMLGQVVDAAQLAGQWRAQ